MITSTPAIAAAEPGATSPKEAIRGEVNYKNSEPGSSRRVSLGHSADDRTAVIQHGHDFVKAIKQIPEGNWRAVVKKLEELEAAADTPSGPTLSAYIYSNCINRMSKCRRVREALNMLEKAEKRGVANM